MDIQSISLTYGVAIGILLDGMYVFLFCLLNNRNQARLQRNLMYLAAIADSQPQPSMHSQVVGLFFYSFLLFYCFISSCVHCFIGEVLLLFLVDIFCTQYPPGGIMQPGAHYLQQQQQQMTPQSLMAARSNMLYGQQQQQQQPYSALQQQQALHSQLGMSTGGSSGLHILQGEAHGAGGGSSGGGFHDFGRESMQAGGGRGGGGMTSGSKHDIGGGGAMSAEGRGGGGGGSGDGGETIYLKSGEDGN